MKELPGTPGVVPCKKQMVLRTSANYILWGKATSQGLSLYHNTVG